MTTHKLSVQVQTWGNTPPFPPVKMFRASCKCGWCGAWYHYEENVERDCAVALSSPETEE